MFPITSEVRSDSEFVFIRMETQGWRPTMEDFMLFQKIDGFNGEKDDIFGIFDGHGGYLISMFCKVVFPEVMAHNMEQIKNESATSKQIDESKIISRALKKTIQDLDIIIKSKLGHILLAFVLINENGSKFPESELDSENFLSYLIKLVQIQERIFPKGSNCNQMIDFMGCTANTCYI